ncbi:hypothetical protein AB0H12_43780 [Actinosynnema sp. NPDC023794]
MANGSVAVVLLNRNSSPATVSASASQIGLGSASSYSLRDLWAHTTSTTGGTISASVPAHGAAVYVVSGGGGNPGGSTFALRGTASNRCLDIAGASSAIALIRFNAMHVTHTGHSHMKCQ